MTHSAADQKPLRVLWLTDDRAGHRNKAAGVMHAFERRREIEVTELPINWMWTPTRQMLGRLGAAGLKLPPGWFLRNALPDGMFDLILSSGGSTQWPNAALSARLGIPNIFCGSLRHFPESLFDVIPIPDPPRETAPFLRLDLLPSNISPDRTREAATATFGRHGDEGVWAVLIGGDGQGFRWTVDGLREFAGCLATAASVRGIKLAVTTSRRTPPDGERALREVLEQSDCLEVADWYHDRQSTPPPLAGLMGLAGKVLVTADSISMTHEAISSGRPVISIQPPVGEPGQRHLDVMQYQKDQGRLADFYLGGSEPLDAVAPDCGWQPISHDPGEALGEALLQRLTEIESSARSAA